MAYAIILAGGSGERAGGGVPKQFKKVLGKPVVAYTLENFQKHPEIEAIMVGCHKEWINYLKEIVDTYSFTKVKWIVDGGDTFQETVMNCKNAMMDKIGDDDIVSIQYSACPFTKQIMITDGIRVAKEKDMAFAAIPYYHLMGTRDEGGISKQYVNRLDYVQVSSPQTYRFGYLKKIYEEGEKQGLLDKVDPHTTSLMSALGYPLYESYSDQTNVKITTIEDLALLEGWVLMKERRAKLGFTEEDVLE